MFVSMKFMRIAALVFLISMVMANSLHQEVETKTIQQVNATKTDQDSPNKNISIGSVIVMPIAFFTKPIVVNVIPRDSFRAYPQRRRYDDDRGYGDSYRYRGYNPDQYSQERASRGAFRRRIDKKDSSSSSDDNKKQGNRSPGIANVDKADQDNKEAKKEQESANNLKPQKKQQTKVVTKQETLSLITKPVIAAISKPEEKSEQKPEQNTQTGKNHDYDDDDEY